MSVQTMRKAHLLLFVVMLGLAATPAQAQCGPKFDQPKGADGKCRGTTKPGDGKSPLCRNGEPPDAHGKCAQAARPDKDKESAPVSACTADLCKNGVCFEKRGFARCNCTNTEFRGRDCSVLKEDWDRKMQDEKAKVEEKKAAMKKMKKSRDRLEQRMKKCSADKRHLCSKQVEGPMADQCVAAATDCFVDETGKFNATLMKKFQRMKEGIKKSCDKSTGEKYCFKEEECIGRGMPCMPQGACPDDKPFRCGRSWKCQENKTLCEKDDARPDPCPRGQQKCPDGECYPGGGGLRECAKHGVQWEGCPAGTMRCRSDRRRCAASEAECADKTGCPAGLEMCGVKRNMTTGKAHLDDTTGKPKSICVANCTMMLERKPKNRKETLNPTDGGELEAITVDGKKAMRLKVRPGNFKVGGVEKAVNFTVRAVPDSLLQEGAFKTLHESGALMGSLIQVEPSEAVEIEGGIELDIPILDPDAQKERALCAAILDELQMVSVSDITVVNESFSSFGKCAKGQLDGCSCAVNITHFSTYAVLDSSIAYEAPAIYDDSPCMLHLCDDGSCVASVEECAQCMLHKCDDGRCVSSVDECEDPDKKCNPGWTLIEDGCFKVILGQAEAIDAESNCVSLGGHLASIHTITQNSAVQKLSPGKLLLGLTDADSEGTWRWTDGSAVTYTNWAEGQPGSDGKDEDWAYLYYSEAWHDCDSNCDGDQTGFVCKISMPGGNGSSFELPPSQSVCADLPGTCVSTEHSEPNWKGAVSTFTQSGCQGIVNTNNGQETLAASFMISESGDSAKIITLNGTDWSGQLKAGGSKMVVQANDLSWKAVLDCSGSQAGSLKEYSPIEQSHPWGQAAFAQCNQPFSWQELIQDMSEDVYKTGGLGTLMEMDGYETWVCLHSSITRPRWNSLQCPNTGPAAEVDPWFCWVYHETREVFTPWGPNSMVKLFVSPPVRHPIRGSSGRFVLVDMPMTWEEARTYCRTHFTDLVSIHSSSANSIVASLCQQATGVNGGGPGDTGIACWIGGYRSMSSQGLDPWAWSDGSAFDFSSWSEGEPNNFGSSGEPYIHMWSDAARVGEWNDNGAGFQAGATVCSAAMDSTGSGYSYWDFDPVDGCVTESEMDARKALEDFVTQEWWPDFASLAGFADAWGAADTCDGISEADFKAFAAEHFSGGPDGECSLCADPTLNCKCSAEKGLSGVCGPAPFCYDAATTAIGGRTAQEQCAADSDVWCGPTNTTNTSSQHPMETPSPFDP